MCNCEFYSAKIWKLDEENKKLKELHQEELKKQKEVFNILFKKETQKIQKKIKCKLFKIQAFT